ncbi:MAG: type II methionyl aminopeptidase, partial [Candidatus Diapherotrites archaeon]|nr:type II methionyl aminopeptidase [Candidatus Diapherotrites archaeon]
MDKEQAENYIKAGKILQKTVEKAKKSIKPGQKLLEIALNIEKNIQGIGEGAGKLAFPVNLSINENAAHFTPSSQEEAVLKASDVMKVDVGVHVDGFIADGAFTLNPDNSHARMVEAAEKALENALAIAKEGTQLGEIGSVIEKTIGEKGFNPVQNLTGHGLMQFEQHASPSIPNIARKDERALEEGHAYAIEPFATDGKGFVREGQQSEIFSLDEPRPVRNEHARNILEFVVEKYQ